MFIPKVTSINTQYLKHRLPLKIQTYLNFLFIFEIQTL